MQRLPFELRYELTRRQRLIPHLKVWQRFGFGVVPILSIMIAAAKTHDSWWFLLLLLFFVFCFRGFFIGLINVLFVRRQTVDIVVEQTGLGFLAGGDRWYVGFDGLKAFGQLATGVWTIQHWNGTVVDIPAELLDDDRVEFFRNWVKKANEIRRKLSIDG